MIKEAIAQLVKREDLTSEVMEQVMEEIMTGEATDAQKASFLTALSMKGETIDEITSAAKVLRSHCERFLNDMDVLEIVGTGGDGSNTINISTLSSVVVSAAGIPVAKHGNRAASSKCGTADCLEALGVKIDCAPARSAQILKDINLCFLFAQKYHPAMRFVGAVRKEMGIRTLFNVLGPLANPAGATMQLFGVYSEELVVNFDRTAGLFHSILYTKLFAVLLLALSCLGTKGVKGEKITWGRIWTALAAGFVLFFLNWWILALPLPVEAVTGLYILTIGTGYVCLLMGGLWMSRLLKHNLMEDVFNNENESFMQETRLIESEYSVNLPTRFYYKKRWNNGWINVVNPFRASIVLGTPGSGKSYAVVNNFIKQQIEKGFSMYVYDFKFSDLSTIAYNHLLNHPEGYKVKPKFYVINFDDPRRSHRCNPIHPDFMEDITDAYESAYTIMLNLNKTWV